MLQLGRGRSISTLAMLMSHRQIGRGESGSQPSYPPFSSPPPIYLAAVFSAPLSLCRPYSPFRCEKRRGRRRRKRPSFEPLPLLLGFLGWPAGPNVAYPLPPSSSSLKLLNPRHFPGRRPPCFLLEERNMTRTKNNIFL